MNSPLKSSNTFSRRTTGSMNKQQKSINSKPQFVLSKTMIINEVYDNSNPRLSRGPSEKSIRLAEKAKKKRKQFYEIVLTQIHEI